MQLFFSQEIEKDLITLSEEESKHLIKVMRSDEGDEIPVTDGHGRQFRTRIADSRPKKCILKIIGELPLHPRAAYHLHIAIAPTKNHDRFEWFAEKATEIGISEITPITCRHSERAKVHDERLERIMISAIKQSNRFWLPELKPLISFNEFMNMQCKGQKFIAYCNDQERKYLQQSYKKGEDAVILIGPEGDFSPEEIKLSADKGFKPVSLGDNRYRTETAALMACHTIALINS